MEYMIFEDLTTAENAELAIEQIGKLPLAGLRASDGVPQPQKAKTEIWDTPRQRKDGKYILARPTKKIRDGYPKEIVDGFVINFPHVIEEYNADWFDKVAE